MAMFKEIADIKTADQLNLDVPKAEFVTTRVPASDAQKEMVDELSDRARLVREKQVEPEEDNMLKIVNDGRKLALDQRLMNLELPDDPNSKVNICVKNVLDVYESTKTQHSTQMIFCDQSTPSKFFNVYDDIREKLIVAGVKPDEIAFIQNAKNEKEKDALFEKVRKGEVRILLGSTVMMGTGTNVQDKLIALHDLDVPWRPSDLEQRSGRIIRQGNENKHVKIFRYVTEGTFDAYLWQILENKQRFISQIMTSKTPVRSADDVDEATLSYAEIKAIATGNPLIKEKMDIDVKLERLKIAMVEFLKAHEQLEHKITHTYPKKIQEYKARLEKINKDIEIIRQNTVLGDDGQEKFSIMLNGKTFSDKKEASNYISTLLKKNGTSRSPLHGLSGEYKGLHISTAFEQPFLHEELILDGNVSLRKNSSAVPGDNINRIIEMANARQKYAQDILNQLFDIAIGNQFVGMHHNFTNSYNIVIAVVVFVQIEDETFNFDRAFGILCLKSFKFFVANDANDFLIRRSVITVLANARQHFMTYPTLKFLCFGLVARENQTIKSRLVDEVSFAASTVNRRPPYV